MSTRVRPRVHTRPPDQLPSLEHIAHVPVWARGPGSGQAFGLHLRRGWQRGECWDVQRRGDVNPALVGEVLQLATPLSSNAELVASYADTTSLCVMDTRLNDAGTVQQNQHPSMEQRSGEGSGTAFVRMKEQEQLRDQGRAKPGIIEDALDQ